MIMHLKMLGKMNIISFCPLSSDVYIGNAADYLSHQGGVINWNHSWSVLFDPASVNKLIFVSIHCSYCLESMNFCVIDICRLCNPSEKGRLPNRSVT